MAARPNFVLERHLSVSWRVIVLVGSRFVLVLFCVVVVAGCNSTDATDLKRDATQLGQTTQRAATNATVAVKVNAALALRKGVDMKGLHVSAEGGIVTIGGHVGSAKEKQTVLEVANNTVGVQKVIDQINIADQKPTPTKA